MQNSPAGVLHFAYSVSFAFGIFYSTAKVRVESRGLSRIVEITFYRGDPSSYYRGLSIVGRMNEVWEFLEKPRDF